MLTKKLTVEKIIAPVTKAIAQLEELERTRTEDADKIDQKIAQMAEDKMDALREASKAEALRKKLSSLVEA